MSKKSKLRSLKLLRKVRTIPFLNILVGLVNKNLKLLLRSKSSALVILLGPLLIIGLVGAAFNTTNFYNINIGTYSDYYSDLTLSIMDELEDKDFNVLKIGTQENCISKIKRNELHVCAVFPDNMKIGEQVKFYVDKTRTNLVWVIMDSISSKISAKTSELSKELTGVLVTTLEDTISQIKDKESALSNAIEANTKLGGEIDTFSKDLKELDLEYSTNDLGLNSIKSQLSSAISSAAVDTSSFDDVFDEIGKSENKSYGFAGKFNDARSKIEETVSNMNLLGSSVKDSLNTMYGVATTLSNIMGKINTIEYAEADTIVAPIKTSVEPVVAEKTHLSNMFPTLLVLVIMFISLLLASTLVVREKTGSSYFRNFITPTKDGMFMFGDFLTNVLVLGLQMAVIFLVSLIFFREALWSVMLSAGFVLLLVISVFIMLGMFIGQVFSSEETSTLGAISIGSILLFFSSTILPLETLPESIRSIANFNPFVIGEAMLKEVMLFNSNLLSLIEPVAILSVYILVLAGFVFVTRKVSKRFI